MGVGVGIGIGKGMRKGIGLGIGIGIGTIKNIRDGQNYLQRCEVAGYHIIALRGAHIALHTMGLQDPIKQNRLICAK